MFRKKLVRHFFQVSFFKIYEFCFQETKRTSYNFSWHIGNTFIILQENFTEMSYDSIIFVPSSNKQADKAERDFNYPREEFIRVLRKNQMKIQDRHERIKAFKQEFGNRIDTDLNNSYRIR